MAIQPSQGSIGSSGSIPGGGLEAFQKLRAQARQKMAPKESPSAGAPAPKGLDLAGLFGLKGKPKEAESEVFASAKAKVLQAADARMAGAPGAVAAGYQKSGAVDKAETRSRLGQYVDLVA